MTAVAGNDTLISIMFWDGGLILCPHSSRDTYPVSKAWRRTPVFLGGDMKIITHIFIIILPLTLIYSILFPIELPTELQINGVNKCAGKRNRLRWLMMGLPWTECLERVDSLTSSHCYRSRARPTLSMHKTVLCKASKRPMEWKRATTTQIHSIYRSNTLSWRFHMIGGGFPWS